MGRYLLVEFDDNDSADRMRAQIDSAEANGRRFRVVGMFSRANSLCECTHRSEHSLRGSKFGWWLCPSCHKAKNGSAQTLMNMLDDPETPAKYREVFLSVRWIRDLVGKVKTVQSVPRRDWK